MQKCKMTKKQKDKKTKILREGFKNQKVGF